MHTHRERLLLFTVGVVITATVCYSSPKEFSKLVYCVFGETVQSVSISIKLKRLGEWYGITHGHASFEQELQCKKQKKKTSEKRQFHSKMKRIVRLCVIQVLASSNSRYSVCSSYVESFSLRMKITVLPGWCPICSEGHLINMNLKQVFKHSLILSLSYWFFFSHSWKLVPHSQTCTICTVCQPQKADYLVMKYHCMSTGTGVLCGAPLKADQASLSHPWDNLGDRDKKIYGKHKLL